MNEQERIAASLALTRELSLKQEFFVDTEAWMIEHGHALAGELVAIAQQGGRHVKRLLAAACIRHDAVASSWVRAKAKEHGIVIEGPVPDPEREVQTITAGDVGVLTIEADGTKRIRP